MRRSLRSVQGRPRPIIEGPRADADALARPRSPPTTRRAARALREAADAAVQEARAREDTASPTTADEDPVEPDPKKRRPPRSHKCICEYEWCQADVDGPWRGHYLPPEPGRALRWLRVLRPSMTPEEREQCVAEEHRRKSRKVHTSHFRVRDKEWGGEAQTLLRLKKDAMPSNQGKASSVPPYAGFPLDEEKYTTYQDKGAHAGQSTASASGGLEGTASGAGRSSRPIAVAGSGSGAGGGAVPAPRGTDGSSDHGLLLSPNRERPRRQIAMLLGVAAGEGRAGVARLNTVNRHVDTLAQDGQSTSNGLRDSKAALRESRTQLDAKEKEIQELNGLNQTLRSENDELRRKLAAETQQSQQALRENSNNAATVHRLLMQQRKMAFKCLLPDDQGGVEEVRRNAKQLTGFSSAEAFVAMWHLLNHDGGAARMKTWTAKNSEELPDRKRKEHARPNAVAVPWEDVFFYWWFVVKTGVNHTVASFLFGIELSTATRKFVSMTSFQDEFWSAQFPKPSLEVIQDTAPADFQHVYRTDAVVCIIDCKEIFTTTPSEPQAQRALWSDYKQHCTVKILSAITPQAQRSGARTRIRAASPTRR